MALRFIYTRPDGVVCFVVAAPKEVLRELIGKPVVTRPRPGEVSVGPKVLSEADYRAHVIARSIPRNATNVKELPENWVAPATRTARNNRAAIDGQPVPEVIARV